MNEKKLLIIVGVAVGVGALLMSRDVIGSDKDIFPDNYDRLLRAAARKYGLSPEMVKSVSANESMVGKFTQLEAIGGTTGIMHIKLSTAQEVDPTVTAEKLKRPEVDIDLGVKYLKKMYDRYKSLPEAQRVRFAVIAYNGGPGRADQVLAMERGQAFKPLNSKDSYAAFVNAKANMDTYWQRYSRHYQQLMAA